jgi:hypothetical protein
MRGVRSPRCVLLLRLEGDTGRDGQCSRRVSRSRSRSKRALAWSIRDGDEFREASPPNGEVALRRDRPLRVLDSSARIGFTWALVMLRCLVRPRMRSFCSAVPASMGDGPISKAELMVDVFVGHLRSQQEEEYRLIPENEIVAKLKKTITQPGGLPGGLCLNFYVPGSWRSNLKVDKARPGAGCVI